MILTGITSIGVSYNLGASPPTPPGPVAFLYDEFLSDPDDSINNRYPVPDGGTGPYAAQWGSPAIEGNGTCWSNPDSSLTFKSSTASATYPLHMYDAPISDFTGVLKIDLKLREQPTSGKIYFGVQNQDTDPIFGDLLPGAQLLINYDANRLVLFTNVGVTIFFIPNASATDTVYRIQLSTDNIFAEVYQDEVFVGSMNCDNPGTNYSFTMQGLSATTAVVEYVKVWSES